MSVQHTERSTPALQKPSEPPKSNFYPATQRPTSSPCQQRFIQPMLPRQNTQLEVSFLRQSTPNSGSSSSLPMAFA
ncbi:unnamed protein product [Schistosoma mattheei]|uniref:Uncharacterized protein n=1 Tax=Schistosoma mattheei TaxID=31246 RepID=A0A183PTS3_9TREM|nr:unnamed protein product [Schistosoma mattheei]